MMGELLGGLVEVTPQFFVRQDAVILVRAPIPADNFSAQCVSVVVYRGPAGERMTYGFKSYSVESIGNAIKFGYTAVKDVTPTPIDQVTHDSFPTRGETGEDGPQDADLDEPSEALAVSASEVLKRLTRDVPPVKGTLREGMRRRWA